MLYAQNRHLPAEFEDALLVFNLRDQFAAVATRIGMS